MSISSIGSDASQVWQHQREGRAQKAGSADGTGAIQKPSRGSFPSLPPVADSSLDGTGTSTGTSGNNGISGSASKLIADVKSLLISLQAGNTATGAAPAAGSASTAAGTGSAVGDGTTSAASSATASSSATGSLSQDQLAGLSTVLNDLSKVHGGGHHHGHGAPPSGSQSADAGGTGAAAISGANAASPAPPESGSTPSNLLAQLGKALSAYVTSQASATSQPSTLIAA